MKILLVFIILSIEWVYCAIRDNIEGAWKWLIYGRIKW